MKFNNFTFPVQYFTCAIYFVCMYNFILFIFVYYLYMFTYVSLSVYKKKTIDFQTRNLFMSQKI